jgi:hypothetical protein
LLADYVLKVPVHLRTNLLPLIYGLSGGLAAVGFQKAASIIFSMFWEMPSQQIQRGAFAFLSLATILVHRIIDFRINNVLSVRGANKTLEIGSSRTASASKDGSFAKNKSRGCASCQGYSAAGEARALSKDYAFGRMRLGVYYALEEAF